MKGACVPNDYLLIDEVFVFLIKFNWNIGFVGTRGRRLTYGCCLNINSYLTVPQSKLCSL